MTERPNPPNPDRAPPLSDDVLVDRALRTVAPAAPADALAARAFQAAMAAPTQGVLAGLLEEIAFLSRAFAGGAVAVAVVLAVVAWQAPADTASTSSPQLAQRAGAQVSDAWLTAALPFDPAALDAASRSQR